MNYLLIGKPNVGKTSIFNILGGSNSNIVHKDINTTRDWHKVLIKNSNHYIYDTPGILFKKNKIDNISDSLINSINTFLYVVDYKTGYNVVDHENIKYLRKYNKKFFLIINKYDNFNKSPEENYDKYGIKTSFYISCSHNYGFEKFIDILNKDNTNSSKIFHLTETNNDYSLAIFGKPNSGKSTFLNTILGYKRSITSNKAGTTSDYVIDYFTYKNKKIKIIDTAGIEKKSRITDDSISFLSIKKTFSNIKQVDVALILIDAQKGLDRQDKRIIKLISDKSKSIIIIFNKFDLIKKKNDYRKEVNNIVNNNFSEIKNIKIFFISALVKINTKSVIDYLYKYIFVYDYNISTNKLNNWLKKVVQKNQHPLIHNKKINFKYAVQIKDKPLTIKVFCNYSNKLKNNYKKYLINDFNYSFNILNQRTKFVFSSSKNPYI